MSRKNTGPAKPAPGPRRQQLSIVTAGFGQNMVLTFVTTFILMYLMEYAHISKEGMASVTVIITAAKIFDALNDPFMGSLVDKTRTRFGKMRPYIILSAFPVALLSSLLFCIPNVSETGKLWFFGVCYFLWGIFYTMCDVPFWGLIGAAFTDKDERAGVIAKVRGIGGIALGLATLGAPWLARLFSVGSGTTTSLGWSLAAITVSAVGMAMFTLAFFGTREKATKEDAPQVSFGVLFKTLFQNKPLFLVLLGSFLGFGRNIIQAGGAVFAVIAYDNEFYFTLIGAAIIVGMVGASFAAPLLLRRFTGKQVMVASSLVSAVFYTAMYFAGFQNIVVMMAMIFLTGLMLGLFMVVQTTMIADAVDDIERRTGVRNDGISFSSLTFVSKIMGSVAVLAFGIALVVAGYEEGALVTAKMQDTVFFSITLVPAISCVLSAIPFAFYNVGAPKTQDEQTA